MKIKYRWNKIAIVVPSPYISLDSENFHFSMSLPMCMPKYENNLGNKSSVIAWRLWFGPFFASRWKTLNEIRDDSE